MEKLIVVGTRKENEYEVVRPLDGPISVKLVVLQILHGPKERIGKEPRSVGSRSRYEANHNPRT